jgi:hypothetical protein
MAFFSQMFGLLFHLSIINFDQKIGWATFWATLLQTHLVTLALAE